MIINAQSGGSFTAYINVTYQKGTCTCTLGDETLTHSGGGTASFEVHKKGTWVVTAKYANLSKSANAAVTEKDQTVSLSLTLAKWFYNEGNLCSSVTGGWDQPSALHYTYGESGQAKNTGTVTKNSGNIYVSAGGSVKFAAAVTVNSISLSGINTLYFRNTSTASGNVFAVLSSRSNNINNYTNASVSISAGSNQTTSLNVSGVSSGYLAIMSKSTGTVTGYEIYGV